MQSGDGSSDLPADLIRSRRFLIQDTLDRRSVDVLHGDRALIEVDVVDAWRPDPGSPCLMHDASLVACPDVPDMRVNLRKPVGLGWSGLHQCFASEELSEGYRGLSSMDDVFFEHHITSL